MTRTSINNQALFQLVSDSKAKITQFWILDLDTDIYLIIIGHSSFLIFS